MAAAFQHINDQTLSFSLHFQKMFVFKGLFGFWRLIGNQFFTLQLMCLLLSLLLLC